MSETMEQMDLIPDSEKLENVPPFKVGDLVMMRTKSLRLRRFHKYPENDVGLVLEVKKGNIEWLINIHWQKFTPRGKCILKHSRLKKVRVKKNVE
jgi:hypothetical protein